MLVTLKCEIEPHEGAPLDTLSKEALAIMATIGRCGKGMACSF